MTENDIESILLEQYPFKQISDLKLLKGGVSNANYLFSYESQKYVVRVCLFEPENQINSLIPFLKYAEKAGYSAPRLIKTNDDSDYVQNGNEPIVVTEYLEGNSADNISVTAQHLESLGRLVANFHNLGYKPLNTPITLDPDYIFDRYDQIKEYKPTDKDAESLQLIELVDVYYEKFKETNFTELVNSFSQGVTHGDINLGNVLVNGGEAISLLDFEEIGTSWQLQDIAMILVTWTFPDGKPNKEFIETFLNEYELCRPLAKIEKENIVNATEFIAFRQCVYAISMMSKGNMKSVKDFSSYWTLLYLRENNLVLSM